MNLILFEPDETARPLPRTDPRAQHLLDVLRRQPGETFDAGLVNGPRGKGKIERIDADALALSFVWQTSVEAPGWITLVVGLPRPQTARDILRDATTLGVAALHFVLTEKSDRNYAGASLWTDGEWSRHVRAGAEQAFATRLPTVEHGATLEATLPGLPPRGLRVALDHYEATQPLSRCALGGDAPVVLALGAERGWSAADRDLLRANRFQLAHLGPRVLRSETAVVAALVLARAARGLA